MPGLCFLLCRCVQTYVSPYVSPVTGYLVVEGYISGNTPGQFTLSRTIPLPGDSTIPVVTGASLQIEGNDNSIYPLTEQGNGVYIVDTLPLSVAVQYRLRISIPNGESYLSDFVPYKPTPAIDSINWVDGGGGGVTIYANTHDVTNSTRYYLWQYTQTWQYNSAEASDYIYNPATNKLAYRTPAQPGLYLLVDVIFYQYPHLPIRPNWSMMSFSSIRCSTSPPNSQQLARENTLIKVTQSSLTVDGYNYLYLMQLNNESLGSIFDVQPSAPVGGNIHSLSNPNETVIGYVSAGTIQQQRIYIKRAQLASWLYSYACQQPDIDVPGVPDSLLYFFNYYGYTPIQEVKLNVYSANYPECIDCTWQGGTTTKPTFWPD